MLQTQFPKLLLDQSNELIWIVDLEFKLVYANKNYLSFIEELTGVEKELNTSVFVEGLEEGYIEKWTTYYTKAFKGEHFKIEELFSHNIQREEISFTPLFEDNDKIVGVACKSKETTKIAGQKSEANKNSAVSSDTSGSEVRLQSFANNLPGVAFQYLIYPDGTGTDALSYVTQGSQKVWGFSAESVEQDNNLVWNQIQLGGELEAVKESIAASVQNRSRWSARWQYVMPDNQLRMHAGFGSPNFLPDGTVIFNSLILDITEESKIEELLNQASNMARIGSWELDLNNPEEHDIYWSPMTREVLGVDENYNPSLTEGFEFYTHESKLRIELAIEELISKGKEFDAEFLIRTQKGKEKWIRCIGKSKFVNGKCMKIYGGFQDIHASKTTEIKMREILESISDAFYAVDKEWRLTYFNKEAEILLNRKKSELIGENIWEVIPATLGTDLETFCEKVGKNQKPESFEYLFPEDNSWYEVNAYPSIDGVSVYFKNIDDRKHTAEQLDKAFEEKNEILESIGDGFFTVNRKWIVTYWNKQAENISRYKRDDIIGKSLWDVYPDLINSDFYRQFHIAMSTKEVVNFEEYYAALNIWVEVTVFPSERGLSIYFKDVTQRKKADIRLQQANERFKLVTKATNDAIWDWDIEQDVFLRSKNIHKFFGSTAVTKMKEHQFWQDRFHPKELDSLKESIQNVLKDPHVQNWQMEYRIFNQKGEELFVIDRGVIVRDENGKAIRMVGAMTDLTGKKKLEKELFQLNKSLENYAKELERSNEELEQFAFITSHDLQEPLRMISSFMDQLKKKYDNQLDEKAHQYIDFAIDGAKRMKQIILDLLLYSRANKQSKEPEEVDLNEILSDFKQLRRKHIAEKSATIVSKSLPLIRTHKAPITQVLHSLLDNALKYSKENVHPHIEISSLENETEWVFSISDNGIGIEEEFFEKIFIIFQRLHTRDQYTGTGIGLSIAKRSVEFMGGRIWLNSSLGKGSTFFFTISKNK